MANKKISELDALVGNLAASDLFEIQKNGETTSKKATLTQLTAVEVAARVAQDDVIEAGAGLNTDGTYPSLSNSWYLRAADFVTGIVDRSGAVANITQAIMGALRLLDYKIYVAMSSLNLWTRDGDLGTLSPTTATDKLKVPSAAIGGDNRVDVNTNGQMSMVGDGRYYSNLKHDVIIADVARASTWIGTLKVLSFDPDSVESYYFSVAMPNSWDEGTNIIPSVRWLPMASAGGAQKVRWGLEYFWQELAEAGVAVDATIYSNVHAPAENLVGYRLYETTFAEIDGTGHTRGSVLHCRLFRDSAILADDFLGDASAVTMNFSIINDALGIYVTH